MSDRMIRSSKGLFLMITLLLPVASHAAGGDVSLDGFISETIRNNPTVRAYIQSHMEAKGDEYRSRGIDDVAFSSLFEAARKDQPQISGLGSTQDKSIQYQVGLSKIISQTGTRVSATYNDYWQRSNYPAGVVAMLSPMNPYYTPSVTLSLTQPLLKNILGRQDQLDKRVSRIQLKLSVVQYEENVEAFISEMTQLYLNWLSSHNDAKTLGDVYRMMSRQEKLIRDKVKANVSEESDLYRVLEQKASYKAQWEGALANYEGLMREIAAMMRPDDPPSDISPVSTDQSFLKSYRKKIAYENDRSMLNATSQVRAYEDQVKYGRLKLQDEVKQFNDGRLTLFQLLEDQSTYINQKVALEASKVDLENIRLLIGELTDVNLNCFEDVIATVTKREE